MTMYTDNVLWIEYNTSDTIYFSFYRLIDSILIPVEKVNNDIDSIVLIVFFYL